MTEQVRFRISLLLALPFLLLAGCSLASEPIPAGPVETGPLPGEAPIAELPAARPSASNGAEIFQQNCVACHGPTGAGDGELADQIAEQGGSLPNFTDPALALSRSPQDWYRIITSGNMQNLMPPWRDSLSDAERWDVAYYLYSLSTPPGALAEGEALYAEHFADRYGEHGELIGLDDPTVLAVLSPQQIIEEYIAGDDVALSEEEQQAVALYMQTFAYDASLEEVAAAPEEESPQAAPEEAGAEEAPAEEAPSAEGEGVVGVVQGQVVNGSPDAEVPPDLEVQLRGLTVEENSIVEFLARSATVEADGTFRFEDVPMDVPRSAYVVSVIYDGVEFTNGAINDPEVTTLELPLTIYETTTDPSVITIDGVHFIIREHPDALLVVQLYVFSNTSDRVFVSPEPVSGARRGSVAIELPPDAYSVTFEEGQLGGRFIAVDNLIYDTEKVLPGDRSHTIILSYFLPYESRSEEVTLPLLYRTDQVTVLVSEDAKVRSDLLTPAGAEVIEGTAYNKYLAQDLPAGETLSFRVQAAGLAGGNLIPILIAVGAGLAVLLIAGAGFARYIRRGGEEAPAGAPLDLDAEQEAILRQIADLDEAFEAGRINRLEYEARRAELKAALAGEWQGEP
ncbi:MAG TPA: c-type cytochrome [Chloroflexi bacterium]|nr:c-type cytochrome [Chloroflexota bacterium]